MATIAPRERGQGQRRIDALLRGYREVRAATVALCEGLSAEDCALQSMPDASPVKWHLAHTSWFFETFVLGPHAPGYRPFDPRFRVLYNSYYVQVGERHPRPERGLLSRPGLDEIRAYRAYVDRAIERWAESRAVQGGALDVLELGLHHEQQHQELILTDLKHLLSRNPLRPVYRAGTPPPASHPAPPPASHSAAPLNWIELPSGIREIGHDSAGFAFDNELPRHRVFVDGFRLASRLVTNAEYLAFMQDGGYERPQLWLSDGWDACSAQRWSAPLYWERDDGRWRAFTLRGMADVDPDEPVCHVSYYEADAYARWAGARLATEAEWEVAAAAAPARGNFVESQRLHPAPAGTGPGLQQAFGDVWEWTGGAYLPYPGYRPAAGAVGEYNGKFMVNQFVLRGGSCATPQSHIRASYRNFFPPAARWQFSGIRLAR
jgi:ergothioneine biosynthesis protein EgtB